MKHIILALILISITSAAIGQIKFEKGCFASAIEKAIREDKLIFVDCYTTWCGPCKQIAATIFPDKEAGNFMNEKFICYKLDMEKGEGIEIRKKYNVNAFPTLLILKSNGEELNRIAGMKPDVTYFIAKMEELSNPQNSLEFKKDQYEKDLTTANGYLNALSAARKQEIFEMVLLETFNRRSPEQRYVLENFKIYDTFLDGITHLLSVMFLNDKPNFIKYLGEKRYNDFVTQKTRNTIHSIYMSSLRNVSIQQCRRFIEFAQKHKDIKKTYLYSFFEKSHEYACAHNIAKFVAICKNYYPAANPLDKRCIQKLVYRMCTTHNHPDLLKDFHENFPPLRN